jgi:hypothetical protein
MLNFVCTSLVSFVKGDPVKHLEKQKKNYFFSFMSSNELPLSVTD